MDAKVSPTIQKFLTRQIFLQLNFFGTDLIIGGICIAQKFFRRQKILKKSQFRPNTVQRFCKKSSTYQQRLQWCWRTLCSIGLNNAADNEHYDWLKLKFGRFQIILNFVVFFWSMVLFTNRVANKFDSGSALFLPKSYKKRLKKAPTNFFKKCHNLGQKRLKFDPPNNFYCIFMH